MGCCLKQQHDPHCKLTGYMPGGGFCPSLLSLLAAECLGNGRTGKAGPGLQQPFSPSFITASTLKAKTVLSCIQEMKADLSLALPQAQLREAVLWEQTRSINLRSVWILAHTSSRTLSKAETRRPHWQDKLGNYRKRMKWPLSVPFLSLGADSAARHVVLECGCER